MFTYLLGVVEDNTDLLSVKKVKMNGKDLKNQFKPVKLKWTKKQRLKFKNKYFRFKIRNDKKKE